MAQPLEITATALQRPAASSEVGANRIEIDAVSLLRWDTLVLPGRMESDRAILVFLQYRVLFGLT